MILSALTTYYQRLLDTPDSGIAQPGYSQEKISYAIILALDGRVVDVHDLCDGGSKKPIPVWMNVPHSEKRTVAIKPNFLWDKTSYALGISATGKRNEQEHAAFKALHQDILAGTEDDGLKALLAFLAHWTPERFQKEYTFIRQGKTMLDTNVVFRLDGAADYLHVQPAACAAWARRQNRTTESTNGMCLVTGEYAPIARLHPAIKGVNGAQSSGASMVSFNLEAFTSYGKSQGENAPISAQAASAYASALNQLLRRGRHNQQCLLIGDTTVVFWAESPAVNKAKKAEDEFSVFLNPNDKDERTTQKLWNLLEHIRQGQPLRDLDGDLDDDTRIFVLGLAPNASRLSIRFWETASLAAFAKRFSDHYNDLLLNPIPWCHTPSPQLLALQTAPIRNGKTKPEDIPPLLAGELTRAILTGTRYPHSVLGALVMRFRADRKISPLRVALCKAILARHARLGREQKNQTNKKEPPMSLDLHNHDPGYLLGRLFSMLEHVQSAALGMHINANICDHYYGAASATPLRIFPMLVRNSKNHLRKLRKEKPWLWITLDTEIVQIINLLQSAFPRHLKIEEQGWFAIGYYHQTQACFAHHNDQCVAHSEGKAA